MRGLVGKDLRQLLGLSQAVSQYVESILNRGMRASLQRVSYRERKAASG